MCFNDNEYSNRVPTNICDVQILELEMMIWGSAPNLKSRL